MVGREQVDSVQLTESDVSGFIETYRCLNEMRKASLNEYSYPLRNSQQFTFHRHKDKNGKYLDDGNCRICGKTRQYLLIQKDIVPMCYRCYQAVRGYEKLLFDPLHLKKKRTLTEDDCKRIVKYMNTYSKKKLVALAAVGAYLAIDFADRKK